MVAFYQQAQIFAQSGKSDEKAISSTRQARLAGILGGLNLYIDPIAFPAAPAIDFFKIAGAESASNSYRKKCDKKPPKKKGGGLG